MWEQYCDKQVRQLGFKPIGEEWASSMYFHEAMKLLLVVYVDDLKLAGPTENMSKEWSRVYASNETEDLARDRSRTISRMHANKR